MRVRDLVRAMGAKPLEIDPLAHDQLMATVSHLPHVFANVLVSQLAEADAAAVPGPSFRDATRVAGSNTAVWSGTRWTTATRSVRRSTMPSNG